MRGKSSPLCCHESLPNAPSPAPRLGGSPPGSALKISEQPSLQPLTVKPYESATLQTVLVSQRCRVCRLACCSRPTGSWTPSAGKNRCATASAPKPAMPPARPTWSMTHLLGFAPDIRPVQEDHAWLLERVGIVQACGGVENVAAHVQGHDRGPAQRRARGLARAAVASLAVKAMDCRPHPNQANRSSPRSTWPGVCGRAQPDIETCGAIAPGTPPDR